MIRQSEAVLRPPQKIVNAGTFAGVSDGELLTRFTAERDELAEIAFAALVRRHGSMVLRVCQQILGDRHTAEDAFQATFLILARRAGSILQPELLGHWLHGVALRTAREARMRDQRRRRRESPMAEGIGGEPIDEAGRPDLPLVCREEFQALHEEVSRLPERYRVPVVLCDLEGLTYQEAAHRLRCPVGTIGVRLRRARERLRVRLTRRGLAPTAGLVGALLGAEVASARVSSVLVDSTVQAAMRFGAVQAATTGLVSTSVVSLTEAVLGIMALTRLKQAISIAVFVGITVTVGWVGAHRASSVQAAPGQGSSQPGDQAPSSKNAAAQGHGKSRPTDEAPSANPAAREQGKPQPRDEVPPPGNPSGSALAGRAIASPATGDQLTVALPMPDGLVSSSRKREEEIVKDLHEKGLKSAADMAAQAGRLPRDEEARGLLLFAKEWVPNDPMSHGGDGLGPVYNETSCVACHGLGAPGGAGPESKNVVLVTATPNGCGPVESLDLIHPGFRGSRTAVLHRYGTEPEYGSWRSRFFDSNRNEQSNPPPNRGKGSILSRIRALKEQTVLARRLRDRSNSLPSRNGFTLHVVERNTPALFGAGRIDAISSEVLVAVAALQPAEARGRVSRTQAGRIGRFGWKGQIPSLHEFVRGACANELGLEVPGHSQATSPLAPSKKAKGLDLTEPDCDALVAYIRALPAPVVVDPSGPQGTEDMREGRRLFADVGCASCHTPTLGNVRGIYSDLLLHDMGPSLSDSGSTYGIGGPDTPGGPTPREWRTPPLWGYRDSGPYLHDGRAQSLEEVVALHEGQGKASAHRFFALASQERSQVEAFLKSLVAPSAAAAPGVVLAAEMESRIDQQEQRAPETLVRQRREKDVERDEQQWRDAPRRRRAEEAAKRARVQIPIAQTLEKTGKITAAVAFYREIARQAHGTEEGRLAARRIAALSTQTGSE